MLLFLLGSELRGDLVKSGEVAHHGEHCDAIEIDWRYEVLGTPLLARCECSGTDIISVQCQWKYSKRPNSIIWPEEEDSCFTRNLSIVTQLGRVSRAIQMVVTHDYILRSAMVV